MSRSFRPFLLLMALIGLLGPTAAIAAAPVQPMTMTMTMAATPCCDGTADGASHDASPCGKLTLHCIAAMGCAAATLMEPLGPTMAGRPRHDPVPIWPIVAPLRGRTYGPEPDPPSRLA